MRAYFQLSSGTVIDTDSPEVWASDPTAKRISAKRGKELLKAEALENLRAILKAGDTVYTVLRHVSSSGMSRRIDLYVVRDNEPRYLTGSVARLLDYRQHNDGGVIVSGCGMDMGFHVVYELSRVLFQGRFQCIGEHCPSNDHSNGDRNHEPHEHSDGGYALRHKWI
jgi:hypothetical protein